MGAGEQMRWIAAAAPALQRLWTDAWNHVRNLIGNGSAQWLTHDAVPGIAWLQFLVSAGVILVTMVLVWLLHHVTRRKIVKEARAEAAETERRKREEKTPAATPARPSWIRLTLKEARPPFFFVVWACGIYGAAWILLFRVRLAGPALLTAINWVAGAALMVAFFWFLYRMVNVVEAELTHWARCRANRWLDIIAAMVVRALRLLAPLVAALFIVPTLSLPAQYHGALQRIATLLLIGGVGYTLCAVAATAQNAVIADFSVEVADNLTMRKVQTQVRMLARIAIVVVGLITVAGMFMVFPSVRQLGTSVLASAGVAGIVIGFAAQKSLGNLIAGIQIAFTQPIRIDDVVIVENEWGRIEEIAMTYVVVAIWDLRRLVVPITYFTEKPFQNWTRVSADLLGTIFLYMDYSVPMAELRTELDRILEHTDLWDGKVKGIQMTDAKEHTVEVRVLVSASDSSKQWDLRCLVREKLVEFLQRNHPAALPQNRVELTALPADADAFSPFRTRS